MKIDEKTMCFLEEHIPELAEAAIKQAYWAALALGNTVLVSENGFLVEVHPNGTRKVIKPLRPSISVSLGQRLEIK